MRLDPVVATRLLFPVPLDSCGVVYACEATYEYYDSPHHVLYTVLSIQILTVCVYLVCEGCVNPVFSVSSSLS